MPANTAELDGSKSSDDKGIVSYLWTRDEGSPAAGVRLQFPIGNLQHHKISEKLSWGSVKLIAALVTSSGIRMYHTGFTLWFLILTLLCLPGGLK